MHDKVYRYGFSYLKQKKCIPTELYLFFNVNVKLNEILNKIVLKSFVDHLLQSFAQ